MKARIWRNRCDCPMCRDEPWMVGIYSDRRALAYQFNGSFPTYSQALAWALETLSTTKEVTK